MALTKAQRATRAARVLGELRPYVWRRDRRGRRLRVVLTLQDGQRIARVFGIVREVAASGAFVMLEDGEPEPLHVPLDVIRSVRTL